MSIHTKRREVTTKKLSKYHYAKSMIINKNKNSFPNIPHAKFNSIE